MDEGHGGSGRCQCRLCESLPEVFRCSMPGCGYEAADGGALAAHSYGHMPRTPLAQPWEEPGGLLVAWGTTIPPLPWTAGWGSEGGPVE